MTDLKVTDAELQAVVSRLGDAAVTTLESGSLGSSALGSEIVDAAFGEVDGLILTVARALSTAASSAATATADAADVLEKSDKSLAGSAK